MVRKVNLIPDWTKVFKTAGVKLAAIAAILATILASNQSLAIGLVMFLPVGPMRYLVAGLIGIIVFVIPTLTQILKRKKPEGSDERS